MLGLMKKVVVFAAATLFLGCTDEIAIAKMPEIGIPYEVARERLIAAGWKPEPAKCSEINICFKATPELATNLEAASTCGLFRKGASSITVCVSPIQDGLLVKSILAGDGSSFNPKSNRDIGRAHAQR